MPNLAKIRVKYNQHLTKAEKGTQEREAYLSICYVLMAQTKLEKAIPGVRRLLQTGDEQSRQLYQEALDLLEGKTTNG